MTCDVCRGLLALDKERLYPVEDRELRLHLASCADCNRSAQAFHPAARRPKVKSEADWQIPSLELPK